MGLFEADSDITMSTPSGRHIRLLKYMFNLLNFYHLATFVSLLLSFLTRLKFKKGQGHIRSLIDQ